MMSANFRELMEKDVPQVLSLFSKLSTEMAQVSFSDLGEEDQIKAWLDNTDTFVYVAVDGDIVLAVIRASRGKRHKSHSVNLTVAVDYKFRGHSIAKGLTNYCMEALKKEEIKVARAYIYSNNPSSIATILSCGFKLSGSVIMHHYDKKNDEYVDDLIFHKVID